MKWSYGLCSVDADWTAGPYKRPFSWPRFRGVPVRVDADEWCPDPRYPRGIRVWHEGRGEMATLTECRGADAIYLVVRYPRGSVLWCDQGFAWVPWVEVIFAGSLRSAAKRLVERQGDAAGVICAVLTGGRRARLVGGDGASITGDYNSVLVAGDYSRITGNNGSVITAGRHATVIGSVHMTITAGNHAKVTADSNATVTVGEYSTVTTGNKCLVTAGGLSVIKSGDSSVLVGGYASRLTGGQFCHLIGDSCTVFRAGAHSTFTQRTADGVKTAALSWGGPIKPGRAYTVGGEGEWVEVEAEA